MNVQPSNDEQILEAIAYLFIHSNHEARQLSGLEQRNHNPCVGSSNLPLATIKNMKQISLKNKKVFVAGHNGLVGQALRERLESEYCKVLTVNKKKLDLRD